MRRTLPDTGARVTAVGASVLLNVERATTLSCALVSRPCDSDSYDASIPQRLHRTCVLLWRFPKLDVPFAVHVFQSASNVSSHARVVRWRMRTHFVGIWRGSLVGSVDIVVARCKVFKACLDVRLAISAPKCACQAFEKSEVGAGAGRASGRKA